MSRGIDIPPKEIEKWRHELVWFRNTYVDYLNKTLGDAQAPQRHLQLRSEVIRQATPAQHILNRLGAQLSWLPPPAVGGPVLSGLINTAFIHEGPHGYAGSGLFGSHCLPATYRLSIFGVDTATTDRFELVLRNARCRIDVSASFRVVPQPKRLHHGRCTTLRRQHSHVIATGCLGSGIPRSIWLDARGRTP